MNGLRSPGALPFPKINWSLCACSGRTSSCGERRDGVHAWKDLCVHRGSKLSLGTISQRSGQACLVCPYHGWEYNSAGQCVRMPAHPEQTPPARAHVESYRGARKIRHDLGLPRQAARRASGIPRRRGSGLSAHFHGPYDYQAQGPRIIENALDVAHLPIAHAGLLGEPSRAEIGDYAVTTTEAGIVAADIPIWQPDPDGTGKPAIVSYTFYVDRPFYDRA